MNFHCGAYPAVAGMPYPNGCVLELPYDDAPAAHRIQTEAKLRLITEALVRCWDPDWGHVSTNRVRVAIRGPRYVGWLTYLSDQFGALPQMSDHYEVRRVGEQGRLIVIKGVDRLTVSNPEHVAAVRNLTKALDVVVD